MPSQFVTIEELKGLAQKGEPFDLPDNAGTVLLRKVMRGYVAEANKFATKKKGEEPDMQLWSDFMTSKVLMAPEVTPDQVPEVFDLRQQKAILNEAFRRGGMTTEAIEEKKDDT